VVAAYATPPGVVEKVRGLLKPKRDTKKKKK
jgi:hypothetical protein